MSKYKFNKEQLSFVEDKLGIKGKIRVVFNYITTSLLLAILYYIVFALIFDTSQEERLVKENKLMAEEYKRVSKKMDILDNVISDLRDRDKEIYKSIFKSSPPDFFSHQYNSQLYSQLDSSADLELVNFSTIKTKNLDSMLTYENRIFSDIMDKAVKNSSVTAIPSLIPLKRINVSQTGASIGKRIHPFYKTTAEHTGIDILAAIGTEVHATADGFVSDVIRSDRGRGNEVIIEHEGGYTSKYAHLGDILVRKSQMVKQNNIIARVGNSGLSFAPHLHYEVIFNGEIMDPVHFFFADLTPNTYREMMILSMSSGQSLD
ncbi:MAG: M23 family metallopeptidase [Bacteroidales bacterium]|jgi:murein DD-endopeptidase MepM/ murein hydrolase activator NlpD